MRAIEMASSANAVQFALQPPIGLLPPELRIQIYEYVLLDGQPKVLPGPPVLPKAPHKPRYPYADGGVKWYKENGTEPNRNNYPDVDKYARAVSDLHARVASFDRAVEKYGERLTEHDAKMARWRETRDRAWAAVASERHQMISPALLQTCRMFREEAMGMFLQQTDPTQQRDATPKSAFSATITAYDAKQFVAYDKVMKFECKPIRVDLRSNVYSRTLSQDAMAMATENLLLWLKAHWSAPEGQLRRPIHAHHVLDVDRTIALRVLFKEAKELGRLKKTWPSVRAGLRDKILAGEVLFLHGRVTMDVA